MFFTLSQYIQSLEALDADGRKDAKIKELISCYQRYHTSVTPQAGTFYGVIYARYSSHSQRDESIEGQVREDLEYAVKNRIVVLGVYIDRALTGRETEHREAFQQMIKDSARHKWQYVITWKVDRFARNRYDAALYKSRLAKNGVRLVYARESIPDGPEGILLEALLEGQAEYYSASLSQNIRRGQEDNALECKHNGGAVLLGYRIENQRYCIEPAAAAQVHRMFELFDSGYTYQQLTDYCNRRGWVTSRGNPFNKNSFQRLLRNRKYIGEYRYRGTVVPGGIPAIIEGELFDRVQRRLNQLEHKQHRRGDTDFLLTTKLFCGKCGKAMTGDSGTSKTGRTYYYYCCTGRRRSKTCDMKPVDRDQIETLVVEETYRLVLNEEMIQYIADRVMDYQERQQQDHSALASLKKQLQETEKGIKNLLDAIEQGILTPTTKSRLEALEERKAALQYSIAEESTAPPIIPRKVIVGWLYLFRGGDVTDDGYRKRLIDTFVNAVYLYEDKIVITYNYSGDGNQVELSLDEIDAAVDAACSEENSSSGAGASAPPHRSKVRFAPIYFCLRRKQRSPICCRKSHRTLIFSIASRFKQIFFNFPENFQQFACFRA